MCVFNAYVKCNRIRKAHTKHAEKYIISSIISNKDLIASEQNYHIEMSLLERVSIIHLFVTYLKDL